MQGQQIPVITSGYIANLHTMLEHLTVKVDAIGTTLENIAAPSVVQAPPPPATFEVSLSFLAAATGASKSTIERRIADNRLPRPRVNQDNRYRYWFKSDLPQALYQQIDARYHEVTKASR